MINKEKGKSDSSSRITFITKMNKRQRLAQIADGYGKNLSSVINEALDHYIELHEWQLKHIQKGVDQAKRGQFAKEKEVDAFFRKHK
jgi:predicted transcriptional regulator